MLAGVVELHRCHMRAGAELMPLGAAGSAAQPASPASERWEVASEELSHRPSSARTLSASSDAWVEFPFCLCPCTTSGMSGRAMQPLQSSRHCGLSLPSADDAFPIYAIILRMRASFASDGREVLTQHEALRC